jgi:heterodisulfide reductase subunit C
LKPESPEPMLPKKFGYTISPDRQIDYDRNDRNVREHLEKAEPTVLQCISCGSCTATCTSGHFVNLNIRRIHTFLIRGETAGLLKEIRKCMLCGKCQLVCPRGVNLRNLILEIHHTLESFTK